MRATLVFLLVALAVPSAARGAPPPAAAPAPGIVDGATAKALVAAGAKVVDVRTPEEFASGHVPGAVNIPHEEIERRAAEIGPRGAPVVLYCRSGRRSAIAAGALRKAGFTQVFDLQSVSAWPGELAR